MPPRPTTDIRDTQGEGVQDRRTVEQRQMQRLQAQGLAPGEFYPSLDALNPRPVRGGGPARKPANPQLLAMLRMLMNGRMGAQGMGGMNGGQGTRY